MESLSDAFGEFIDQTNATGSNWASDRWKLGEDVAGYGPFRNMADPTQFGDPDRMGSPNYYHGWSDNGGVHTNSGVGNKLVYLMTDGGKFNGQTITGLSLTKAPLVEVLGGRLVSSSQYVDYGLALRASCIAAWWGSAGITTTVLRSRSSVRWRRSRSRPHRRRHRLLRRSPVGWVRSKVVKKGLDTGRSHGAGAWRHRRTG